MQDERGLDASSQSTAWRILRVKGGKQTSHLHRRVRRMCVARKSLVGRRRYRSEEQVTWTLPQAWYRLRPNQRNPERLWLFSGGKV
jgi:hypothetical protein